ncbi:THAP domain-containing protein 10-like [Dysidea avara]|uniref:THAP domain-containing protein 10-like n=1 Tax=Dysidea avara TaxID=196820 RepID=UPI003331B7C2
MPRRCVAADCHTECGRRYSLHEFPSDGTLRAKWTRAIQQQRRNWGGPTPHSLLCAKHFTPECFETDGSRYRDAIGIPAKKRLKRGAIPTIFPRSIHGGSSQPSAPPKRPASERRRRKSIADEVLQTSLTEDLQSTPLLEYANTEQLESATSEQLESATFSQWDTESDQLEVELESATTEQPPAQMEIQTHTQNKESVGIQCNLLAVPPLKKFSCTTDSCTTELLLSSEPEETEPDETDLESSFYISQDEASTDDDIQQPCSSIQSGSTLDELKYIVFRSSLLELFTHCPSCHSLCPGITTKPQGTFVTVKQACSHCGYQRSWSSQPHIKDTPAGNIMLSAAILYSGGTAGKFFRALSHMNVACITDRTYYTHQKKYLQPAVISIWNAKQSELLNKCRATGSPLTIGGDGRADSPGHSAKFGSYGIIDLSINKVIHIELVQVSHNT